MTGMLFKTFARQCFGPRYARLGRSLVLSGLLFAGLRMGAWRLAVAPFVLCLMSGAFSATVMGHALLAAENVHTLRHAQMLPLAPQHLVRPYVGVLGLYTLATKTAPLLAIVLAVSAWRWSLLPGVLLSACLGVLLAAVTLALRRPWLGLFWMVLLIFQLWHLAGTLALALLLALQMGLAVWLLGRLDGQALVRTARASAPQRKPHRHALIWRYFARYLSAHPNYLVNTLGLWGLALVLPLLLAPFGEARFVVPIGLALLTLNTPLGILLSCDPALTRAVRMLPNQVRRFCLPYGCLLCALGLCSDAIFLASWRLQTHTFDVALLGTAPLFVIQSAVLTVWLEWRHPLRKWRIESDLWHHPRKYLVVGIMLCLAALLGAWPWLSVPMWTLLALEALAIAWHCLRRA